MAYDSATPTALALRAYERANLEAQARRARLNQGYGLNDDGTMNADTTGSIYQGNLGAVNQAEGAEMVDRRRGFRGVGGLAGKSQAAADNAAQMNQAGMLRDAFGNIAQTRQDEQNNKGQYEDQLTQVRANASADLARILTENPVEIPASAPSPVAPGNPYSGPQIGGSVTNYAALFKSNPKKYQTIKGKF